MVLHLVEFSFDDLEASAFVAKQDALAIQKHSASTAGFVVMLADCGWLG